MITKFTHVQVSVVCFAVLLWWAWTIRDGASLPATAGSDAALIRGTMSHDDLSTVGA